MIRCITLFLLLTSYLYSQEIKFPELKPKSDYSFNVELFKKSLFENQKKIEQTYTSCQIKREKYMPTPDSDSKLVTTLNQQIKRIPVNTENFYFGLFPKFNNGDIFIISAIIADTVIIKIISEDKLTNRYFDNLHLYFDAKSKKIMKIKGIFHIYSMATFTKELVENIHEADDYSLKFLEKDGILLPTKCIFSYPNNNLTNKSIDQNKRTKEIVYYSY